MQKATRQHTKEHNRDLVLKIIFERDTVSRADIARITRLTPTTVSDVVAAQIAEGLVDEVGTGASIGGKSPILLGLVPDSRFLIGLNLAHDQFCGAVINLRGEIKEMISLPVHDWTGEQALEAVFDILDRLSSKPWRPLVGIGVGTPGLVNTRDGLVINAVNLDWQNLPLAHLIQARYHLPVSVLNDSQAAAIGEYVYGNGQSSNENLIVVNARQGIGAGILIDGRLFQGDGGGAGEIGHVVVQEGGDQCRCGNHGCLETVASARAVVQRARRLAANSPESQLAQDPQAINMDLLVTAFESGDPLAHQVVMDAGRYLGLAIAGLVGVLNIHKIVLTGEMVRFGQPWLDAVTQKLMQATLARLVKDTQVEISQMDVKGCILGASASLLLDGYSLLYLQPLPEGYA